MAPADAEEPASSVDPPHRTSGRLPEGPAGEPAWEGVGGTAPASHRLRRDRVLGAEGWTRRFVGSPPRLDEIVELYQSTGREVFLDALAPEELSERCEGCGLALALFRAVYTRPAARSTQPGPAPGTDSDRREK